MRADLTAERLRETLSYSPETGAFAWRRKPANAKRADAGCRASSGYVLIRIDDVLYKAHRLAWLYVHGEWPSKFIDHINRDKSDNRIVNLRIATRTQNTHNVGMFSSNTSGFKGVSLHKASGLYQAYMWIGNKKKSLGYSRTPRGAYEKYCTAVVATRGEFACLAP